MLIQSYGHEVCDAGKQPESYILPHNSIHFVFRGKGYFNGICLTAGDMFICRQNVPFIYYPHKEDPWTYGWINITNGHEFDELMKYIVFNEKDIGKFDTDKHYETYLKMLRSFYNDNPTSGQVNVYDTSKCLRNSAYYMILALLAVDNHRSRVSDTVTPDSHTQIAKQLIEQHYRENNLTIAFVADFIHVSTGYLRTLFKTHLGMSPQEYLLKIRMEKAAEYLGTTDYSVSLIANSVGYNDGLHFSKMFKKYYGICPTQMRKHRLPPKD